VLTKKVKADILVYVAGSGGKRNIKDETNEQQKSKKSIDLRNEK